MTNQKTSQKPDAARGGVIVYQVHGRELVSIPFSFLNMVKGVYGWYILDVDVGRLDPDFHDQPNQESGGERIYLYIGTVGNEPRRCVAARFVNELLGPQVCSDGANRKFDTDFAVSCAVEFLAAKGINVYFDVLSDIQGHSEEMRIALQTQPLLQKITSNTVQLRPDIKRTISGNSIDEEIAALGAAVLKKVKERISL